MENESIELALLLLDEDISNEKRKEILRRLLDITKENVLKLKEYELNNEQKLQELEKLLENK
jgi:hypothetical protein